MENLLQDYYLDDYFLRKIKNAKNKHEKLLKKCDEMSKQNNDNVDDDRNESSITLTTYE